MAAMGVGTLVEVVVGDGAASVGGQADGDGVATAAVSRMAGIVSLLTAVSVGSTAPVASTCARVAVGLLVIVAVTAMNEGTGLRQPCWLAEYRPALLTSKIKATQAAASCFCQGWFKNGAERRTGAAGLNRLNRPGAG
jgi:hypothetical protein